MDATDDVAQVFTTDPDVRSLVEEQDRMFRLMFQTVEAIAAEVHALHDEFQRYRPLLESYVGPQASGLNAWAGKRAMRKAGTNGQG